MVFLGPNSIGSVYGPSGGISNSLPRSRHELLWAFADGPEMNGPSLGQLSDVSEAEHVPVWYIAESTRLVAGAVPEPGHSAS